MIGIGDDEDDDNDNDSHIENPEALVLAVRDLIHDNRWYGKRYYKDGRTWKQRLRAQHENWAPMLDLMTKAFVEWQYGSGPDSSRSSHPKFSFDIPVIDLYTLERTAHISRDENTEPNVALVRSGYLGNTPINPSLAISLRTLNLFHMFRLFKASLSVESFEKTLCHNYKASIPYRRSYHSALSDAFDIYLTILYHFVEARVLKELEQDGPNYRILNSCSACCYELENEPHTSFTRMWVVDSNNSLKHIKGINGREIADTHVFTSDLFLEPEFVDKFAKEVRTSVGDDSGKDRGEDDDGDEANNRDNDNATEKVNEGDPTDGNGEDLDPVLAKVLGDCAEKWKASAKEESKKMWAIFKESGIFARACRHGFILWIADMIESALEVFGDCWILGYDIGCRFARTILSSSLGQRFQEKHCRTYSHNIICQQHNHPLSIPGMGLEDLETLERVFSASNQRQVFLDIYFRQWDCEKYRNLGLMIYNNYVQALKVIEEDGVAVQAVLNDLKITESDLDTYFQDEVEHFGNLGTEAPEDVHAVAYVELLQMYRSLNVEYEEASSQFRLHIPGDYTPLSAEQQYNTALSETHKLESKRRLIREKRDRVLDEVVEMEVQMGIAEGERWEPGSPKFELENLYKLVVQCLFELHRLNLSQTGYKMRTHISQALQKRSQAIRNAVRRYNAVATALDSQRPTLDWSKISHFSFLDEFNILQDTRHSVFEKPWAQPNIRETMKHHQRVQRAHEEIVRCNIKLRRVHTSIVNEEAKFRVVLDHLKTQSSPDYGPVYEYIVHRRGANRLIMEQIERVHSLPSFTSDKTPAPPVPPLSSELPPSNLEEYPQNVDNDSDVDEDNNELTEGVGVMVDWVSSLV
ncbi:hypothetical protein K435DRAFT_821823 [Dendrothele bispora CBS 962.96]|uniref:CxC1-like cysteine cluster associated with KDZ transposases domain-containing protein n=1 Tax=Dendrothele bispora (strain CBS 962.96) TaxID=1314807 RepID=A0A4S8LFT7_DENBC|nr:hypothetical protein K435DRAFT_821823 [Dendrothele bispora CBS 962.96]